jgi:Uma2 family endonuclease
MHIAEHLITIDEFEDFIAQAEQRERHYELIDGRIVEQSMPTERHGLLALKLGARLLAYCEISGRGRVGVEIRAYSASADPHNLRQPDISYYADASRPIVERGAVPQLPDLAIEIKSPDDSLKDMRAKAIYYLAHGSEMVWLIQPEKRLIDVYTHNDVRVLDRHDTLEGGELLPEFSLLVAELFG